MRMLKTATAVIVALLTHACLQQPQDVEWVATAATSTWTERPALEVSETADMSDVEIRLDQPLQTIEGFGSCFNELGWTSLAFLRDEDREGIMKELFAPGEGADFNICRMPVGANDFARKWYSYDEVDGDFEMNHFSIANDLETLVPFIKNALKYNPDLKIWASPWSPPTWMKYNKHYALRNFPKNLPKNFKLERLDFDFEGLDNGLMPDQVGKEGSDMFIQEDRYFAAYALYFARFIEAYRQQGINISMVMPQNEFNSVQNFPSCTWTAKGLAKFIGYLGPAMEKLNVDIFFGTMERPNEALVDTVLTDEESGKYIEGVGFQWAGKEALPGIHKRYPDLPLYQTEQECGDGKNDWKLCKYSWNLMKHYLGNGTNAYLYWNTSLAEGGISTWGWRQNSLVSVDTLAGTFKYNYEYFLIKHFSYFIKPGAKRLETDGAFDNLLAFINPDSSIVIVAHNDSTEDRTISIKVGDKAITPTMQADSFNTWVLRP